MASMRHRIVSNKFFRKAGMALLLLLAAELTFEFLWIVLSSYNGYRDPLEDNLEWALIFRGFELIAPSYPSLAANLLKFALAGLTMLILSAWLFCAMRNLRAMGVHSRLEPGWIVASWVITPLLAISFPLAVRDIITQYCRIYDLLGRKPGVKMPRKHRLHRWFTQWYASFWLGHILMVLGLHTLVIRIAEGLYITTPQANWASLVVTMVFVLVPLLLGARFLYRYGKVEDAVEEIGSTGMLENWRDAKLQSGQIHADHSALPEWYAQPNELPLELAENEVFQDQSRNENTKPT